MGETCLCSCKMLNRRGKLHEMAGVRGWAAAGGVEEKQQHIAGGIEPCRNRRESRCCIICRSSGTLTDARRGEGVVMSRYSTETVYLKDRRYRGAFNALLVFEASRSEINQLCPILIPVSFQDRFRLRQWET